MTVLFASEAPGLIGPYVHAHLHGSVIYTSGQLPIDPATGALVSDDIVAQLRQCLVNIEAIGKAAGAGRRDILKITLMLTSLDRMPELNAAYAAFFGTDFPARATLQVAGLPLGARVELDAIIAAPPGGSKSGTAP